MRGRAVQIWLVLATVFAGSMASANTVTSVVQDCMRKTGAPGAYSVSTSQAVPQVIPATGATQTGAALVNDCLADKYQVQFSAVQTAAVAPVDTRSGRVSQSRCQKLLNRGRGNSFARGFAVSIGFGAIGSGVHATTLTRNFQNCIESGAYGGFGNVRGTDQVFQIRDCGRGSNVFQGGSSYCRD